MGPSRHTGDRADPSADVVSEQWQLAVWTLADWSVLHSQGKVVFHDGETHIPCPQCRFLLPLSGRQGPVYCPGDPCREDSHPIYVLRDIAKTPFSSAAHAARTMRGGVRGYPLLRGMRSRLQLPVLHCTGNTSRVMAHLVLSCLPTTVQDMAKMTILAIVEKGAMDAIYLREFRELVAHGVARPEIFSRDLDRVFFILFQLARLMNAARRASLADAGSSARIGASSIPRLRHPSSARSTKRLNL